MASRSGTTNGANRDVERACESGRRAIRCGAGLVCDTVRARTACVLTDRDGVRAMDRDDERHGAGPDGERTVGTAFDMRCGYDRRVRTVRFGTMCERDGAGAAGAAGRVHGCCASSWRDRRRRGPLRPTTQHLTERSSLLLEYASTPWPSPRTGWRCLRWSFRTPGSPEYGRNR